MGWWRRLKKKLDDALRKYGPVAFVVWFSIFGLTLSGFYLALSNGVDLVAMAQSWGFDGAAVAAETGTIAIAYAATQLTKPIRIVLFLALTPPIAHWWARRRAAQGS
ncbi:MAG TPA: DUF1279 domain-containing protein [Myxococcota bacterium]|jgi:hypothetical protein|nr:DUF1279 domain-containing protein [Myxococcota bacterium]